MCAERCRKIAVIYHSLSGNTAAAADCIIEGVEQEGDFEIARVNTDEERLDPAVLAECAGAAFGTPDYFSYPAGTMKTFMDDWLIAKRKGNEEIEGIPIAMFLTHGGGGAAKKPFGELFRRIGPPIDEVLAIKGKPQGGDVQKCREMGRKLAQHAASFLAEQ